MKLKVISCSIVDKIGAIYLPGQIVDSSIFPEENVKDWLARGVLSEDKTLPAPKTEIDKVKAKDK